MCDVKFLKMVNDLECTSTSSADIADALILALHELNQHVKHYKFSKRIYILTDGAKEINTADNSVIQEQIRMHSVEVKLVYIYLF